MKQFRSPAKKESKYPTIHSKEAPHPSFLIPEKWKPKSRLVRGNMNAVATCQGSLQNMGVFDMPAL
jgi:hypothetical protein